MRLFAFLNNKSNFTFSKNAHEYCMKAFPGSQEGLTENLGLCISDPLYKSHFVGSSTGSRILDRIEDPRANEILHEKFSHAKC